MSQYIKRIAFPECVVASYKNLREKTVILGQIARVCAIFRIEEIIFFKSPFMTSIDRKKERKRVETILSYIETPQYLRKWLFPIMKELAYAGELPPLATPHHPDRAHSRLKEGEYREGLVYLDEKRVVAEIGRNNPISIINPPASSIKNKQIRMTVKILKNDQGAFVGKIINRKEISSRHYTGYRIKYLNSTLGKWKDGDYHLVITSRKGTSYRKLSASDILPTTDKKLIIVFGSAVRGLYEFLKPENKTLEQLGWLSINTVPDTGVRNVRLEEALPISLSRLNDIISS
ncbi:MAG: putative RNA uridine N3 methyltransferase [Candidatus Hodarchaeales archaeon]